MDKKPSILVVDDNQANIVAIKTILSNNEVELHSCTSGSEALSLLLRHDYAVILLDVQMPVMNGYETAELIQNNDQTRHIPIIFVTANSKDELQVSKGYSTGAVDYLFKPLNDYILKSKVNVFVKMYQQKKEIEASFQSMKMLKRELERSNAELSDFSHVISHDLRAPIRHILAYADFLKDEMTAMSDDGVEWLEKICAASKRMDQLIGDLNELAKVNTQVKRDKDINLNKVLKEVTEDLQTMIKNSSCQLEVGNLPTIKGNHVQMRQVFQNLISNSIKYCDPSRRPKISIQHSMNSNKAVHHIQIEDNGLGFDPSQRDLIFLPFKRLDTSQLIEGTGIGLATVKKIVDQHHGTISVDSTPGKGSVFTVSLPNGAH